MDIDKLAERLLAAVADLVSDEPTEIVETVSHDDPPKEDSLAPAVVSNVTVVNFFRHPEAHPLVLDLCLLKKYGPDFLMWEPETIEVRVPQDFHTTEVSDLNLAKINAVRTLHLVDTYWQRWEVFTWVTAALNGFFPDFESAQVPTVTQAAISAFIAAKVRDDVPWSSELTAFLAQVMRFEGVFLPPEPLAFVPVDLEDFGFNPKELQEAWAVSSKLGRAGSAETVYNEQCRRALLVKQSLEDNRTLLRAQLTLVQHV